MKCSDCGKVIGNWPAWLENSRVGVRCSQCAGANALPVNSPKEHTTLAPLADVAARYANLAEAA